MRRVTQSPQIVDIFKNAILLSGRTRAIVSSLSLSIDNWAQTESSTKHCQYMKGAGVARTMAVAIH
jgi:hypothetical protein